ncbi:MAG: DUF2442 domain-containing protein [Deltaproteobacteria bacterium]|nr:DUF2442 domain-containing protein [Deltaproteobacteria bacterium]
MWDMNEVKRIEYKHEYIYEVHFDNGLCAEVDFEPYLTRGPVFEPLRDIEYFKRATVEGGTISWPNGADISPESLYEKVESANQRLQSDWPSASLQANR